jgi:hypothetical protein
MRRSIQLTTLVAGVIIGLSVSVTSAAAVVDWDGANNYQSNGTAGLNFGRAQTTTPINSNGNGITGITFDAATPLNPGAGYDSALSSGVFYGGLERRRTGNTTDGNAFINAKVRDRAASDTSDTIYAQFQVNSTDSARQYRVTGAYVWALETPIVHDGQIKLTTEVRVNNIDVAYVIVRSGGSYYIGSGDGQISMAAAVQTKTLGLANTFWKQVDLSTTYLSDVDLSSGFAQPAIGDIDMIGIFFRTNQVPWDANAGPNSNGQFQSIFQVFQYSVDATVIPEPASLGMLGFAGLLALRRRA